MIFTTQCLDAILAFEGVMVVAEDSRSQMNHARPIRTSRQHRTPCRRVVVVALELARKQRNAKRLRARQTSEAAVFADVAAAGVVARNPVRSVYHRRESAVRQLMHRVENRPARRVALRSHLVPIEAVAVEPWNVQGANPPRFYVYRFFAQGVP